MLEIDRWPEMRDPVLVVALSGWVDAGLAGAGAAALLSDQLGSASEFGRVDLTDLVDLQQTRPSVRLVDGATREIMWPTVDLIAGRAGVDVVLCRGPEPSLRWRAFTDELVQTAQRLGVRMMFGLGGMPTLVSHRRPVTVLTTATARSLAQEVGAWRADYTGPTGAQTALQVAFGHAGIPGVGLWAQVPHYVSATPSPPAISALLSRLREIAGIETDLSTLDDQVDEYLRRVEEGLSERPDVAEMVHNIEATEDSGEIPTGDELASEIERFLREQG
ncbi:MAG TPA: PAC2 family protein [Acidimicrobiia bacterium]|nr:PAC2 family protein [Acidimicrobiia bacterium]